jgi:hypothetical protein
MQCRVKQVVIRPFCHAHHKDRQKAVPE